MSNEINKYQPDAQFQQSAQGDEIDLRELFTAIWQGKWLIIAITTVFAIGAVIYAINQPNTYKSEALLVPASEEQGGGLSALAGQFGGLASMAGINLGGGSGIDKTQMAIEVMKSHQFISQFIQKYKILPDLMAIDSWNIHTGEVKYYKDIYSAETGEWLRNVKPPLKPEPSMQEAYKVFMQLNTISKSNDSGMVTLAIEHQSPQIAKQWVTWLVQEINQEMKKRDVLEAEKSVSFLETKIQQTNVADIRSILFNLIEEQTKIIMFAEVRDEYVFKTIDPALVPEFKAGPKRALICVLGTFLGGILGVMIILIRHFIRMDSSMFKPDPN